MLHVEFFLEAIWTGINMDSPEASAGAMDAPNGAEECGGDSSTIVGKRPSVNETTASSSNDTVSVERSFYAICDFLATGRARASLCSKLKGSGWSPVVSFHSLGDKLCFCHGLCGCIYARVYLKT